MTTDPFAALAARPGGALALLIAAEGGFPRRPGAAMALWPDGGRVGRLGAGCIDADIAVHVGAARAVTHLTYGLGGPIDLPLPCGGTVHIALIQRPDPVWLAAIGADSAARRTGRWRIDLVTGAASRDAATGFALVLPPPPAVILHGEGDEAEALASMVAALDLPCHRGEKAPPPDAQSAVVTLFHDHDRELPPLRAALASPAFYIGALGSRRAQLARQAALRETGIDEAALVRLRGPIGVVSPVREPRLLAASVLTEILAAYDAQFG